MIGGDPQQFLVGVVWPDTAEERADLPLPLPQICAQDRGFLIVGKLL